MNYRSLLLQYLPNQTTNNESMKKGIKKIDEKQKFVWLRTSCTNQLPLRCNYLTQPRGILQGMTKIQQVNNQIWMKRKHWELNLGHRFGCSTLEWHNLFFLSKKISENWKYTLRRLMSQVCFFQQKFRFSLISTGLIP